VTARPPTLSLVVPCFDEEANIAPFLDAVRPVLDGIREPWALVLGTHSSRAGPLAAPLAPPAPAPRIRVVGLARNFGKEIALTAGLAHARGRAVIPIDADLQHPPELIVQFVERWRAGAEMVVGVRTERDEDGWLRRTLTRAFYRLLSRVTRINVPANAGDFRLMDRKIVDVLNAMPERCRFMKGLYAWPGFRSVEVPFVARRRLHAGSRFPLMSLFRLAMDGMFSFSRAPLQIWTWAGVLCALGSFVYLCLTLFEKFYYGLDVPGPPSGLGVRLFLNAMRLPSDGLRWE